MELQHWGIAQFKILQELDKMFSKEPELLAPEIIEKWKEYGKFDIRKLLDDGKIKLQ